MIEKFKRRSEIKENIELRIQVVTEQLNGNLDEDERDSLIEELKSLTKIRDDFEGIKMAPVSWDTILKIVGSAVMAGLVLKHERDGEIITTKAWDFIKRI